MRARGSGQSPDIPQFAVILFVVMSVALRHLYGRTWSARVLSPACGRFILKNQPSDETAT
jgi:hypothetical protein